MKLLPTFMPPRFILTANTEGKETEFVILLLFWLANFISDLKLAFINTARNYPFYL